MINPRSYEHYWTSCWNKTWKKFWSTWCLNPWPLRYWCSALPTELANWERVIMLDPNEPSKGWIMAVNIWKSCEHCGWKNKYRIDPHSYEHYWTSSWNKAWKKFRPIQDLNPWPLWYWCSALPTELTSQLELVIMLDTNKPLKWWIMAVNIWKSYVCTAVEV